MPDLDHSLRRERPSEACWARPCMWHVMWVRMKRLEDWSRCRELGGWVQGSPGTAAAEAPAQAGVLRLVAGLFPITVGCHGSLPGIVFPPGLAAPDSQSASSVDPMSSEAA